MAQSDPVHGSLGPKKAKREDLTEEQKFEYDQRRKKAAVYADDKDNVDTMESLKTAEGIVGGSMTDPADPGQKDKLKKENPKVMYTFHDSDDEEDDTYQTRKSIKTAEKSLKTRFFINEKDKSNFNKMLKDGKVNKDVAEFKEKGNAEITQTDEDKAKSKADKIAAGENLAKDKKEAEDAKAGGEKVEEKGQDAGEQKKQEETAPDAKDEAKEKAEEAAKGDAAKDKAPAESKTKAEKLEAAAGGDEEFTPDELAVQLRNEM